MTAGKIIYVDSINGNDSYEGTALKPLKTIAQALVDYKSGATIALYTGAYSAITISDTHLKIVSLPDSSPVVDAITITNGQGSFNGIEVTNGISVSNSRMFGALNVQKCTITSGTAISTNNVRYVSVHRNKIDTATNGISITLAEEAAISANVIEGTATPLEISSVDRADFYLNTLDNGSNLSIDFPTSAAISQYNVSYIYITETMIAQSRLTLPVSNIVGIAINVVGGSSLNNGVDFQVIGGAVDWNSLGLEGVISEGDVLRIIYTTLEITRVRVDSNNITDVSDNILVTSDYSFNNFYNSNTSGSLGSNIKVDPQYTSPPADLSIQPGSPNVDAANPTRWDEVFIEVVPMGRNIDYDGAHRFYAQNDLTGDIGAYEILNNTHTGTEFYIKESGFNVVNSGDINDPLLSLSTAFSSGNDPINIILEDSPTNKRSTTIVESSLSLSNSEVSIYEPQAPVSPYVERVDVAYIRPYLSEIPTGTLAYVSPEGDDDTADGTELLPYRTIDAALASAATNILVLPGEYEFFTGVSGKKIIFLDNTDSYTFSNFANSKVNNSLWSISEVSGGQVGILGNVISLTNTDGSSQTSMTSTYAFNNLRDNTTPASVASTIGIKAKAALYTTGTSSKTIIKVENANHSAFVEYGDGYVKLGVGTYDPARSQYVEYAKVSNQPSERGWASITIQDYEVEVEFRSASITRTYKALLNDNSGALDHRYNWSLSVESSGDSAGETSTEIENLNVVADSPYVTPGELTVEYHTLTALNVSQKYFSLTGILANPTNIALNITEGTSQLVGTDFQLIGSSQINWSGLGMEYLPLSAGDTIKVMYNKADMPAGGINTHKIGKTISGLR